MLADCISKHCFISVQKHKLNRSGFIITGKTWISWYNKGLNLMIFQKDFKCLWFPEHNWNRIYMNRTDFKTILAIIKQRQTTKGLHKTFLLSKMDSDELKKNNFSRWTHSKYLIMQKNHTNALWMCFWSTFLVCLSYSSCIHTHFLPSDS